MRNILVIAILITALGTILFFPLDIKGKYTCFFHRIFDHSHPVSDANGSNLLENYIDHYAFAWWANVGLFALTFIRWRQLRKIRNQN